MADKRAYTGLVQPPKSPDERLLRPQAAVCAVVYIARDQQRVDTLLDTQVDYVLVGLERGLVESLGNVLRGGAPDTSERAV